MRPSFAARRALRIALFALLLAAAPASAQTNYFWNAPNGGAGTWDTTNSLWSTNPAGPLNYTWTNSGLEIANFGNTAGTVTLGTGITAFGLNFSTSGYNVTGNVLTLEGVIDTGAFDATIDAIIQGNGGLTKNGTGSLTLGGANTYTGATTVNGGTLSITDDGALGAVPGSATPGSIVLNAGTLRATSTFQLQANRGMTIGTGSAGGVGRIDVAGGQTLTYNGVIANNAAASQLHKLGGGTLSLGGANTFSGGTLIQGGTMVLGNTGALGSAGVVTIAPTSASDASLLLNVGGSFARPIVIGELNDAGTGRVVIGAQNGLASSLVFSAGTLAVRRPFTIQAGSSAGNTTFSNVQFLQEGSTVAHMTISAPTPATPINNRVIFFNPSVASTFGDMTIGDVAGPHAVVQFGSGTDSGRIVPDSSVINFFKAPDAGGGGSVLILAPDVVATGETIGALHSLETGAGTITTLNADAFDAIYTLTVGGGDRSGTFSGVITQGTGTGNADVAIAKTGTGTQVFSGNNTYTAGSTVNAGTLLVMGQTGSNSGTGTGGVTVNTGGTFGGDGRAGGAVTVNSGGTLRGGDATGVGTLIIGGNLTFNSGARQAFRITAAGTPAAVSTGGSSAGTIPDPTNHNFIDIGGSFLPMGDTSTYQFVVDGTGATFDPALTYSYQIGRVATDVVPPFVLNNQAQFIPIGFSDPHTFSITGNGAGAVYLNIAPVPEPATVLALAAGALGAGAYLRRRLRPEVAR